MVSLTDQSHKPDESCNHGLELDLAGSYETYRKDHDIVFDQEKDQARKEDTRGASENIIRSGMSSCSESQVEEKDDDLC